MDRYFYTVEYETGTDNKLVHFYGNVYFNDAIQAWQHVEWTGLYVSLSDLAEMIEDDTMYEYINERVNYSSDLTEVQAQEACKFYFCGSPGTELHIKNIDENTSCGEYWFET